MLKHYLTGQLWPFAGILTDAPDATAAGGPATAADSAAASTAGTDSDGTGTGDDADMAPASDAGAETSAGTEGTVDDDSLDFGEDDNAHTRPADERLRAVLAKNKKLYNRLNRMKPVYDRVRGLELDRVLHDARTFGELRESIANARPDEVLRLLGLDRATSRGAEPEQDADLFDLGALPFDLDNPVNQLIGRVLETVNRQQREIKRLSSGHQNIEQRTAREAQAQRLSAWRSATAAAASKIENRGVRLLFNDALEHAFVHQEQQRAAGRRPRSVEFIVNHYLTNLGVSDKTRKLANDAMRQRTAERTATLSKQPASSGTPAGPNDQPAKTWEDARRRMTAAG